MKSTDFSNIASRYDQDSLIQKSAAEKLVNLLDIRRDDDILDLGCGTGGLTRKIRSLTDGKVVGVDPSTGMILEADANRAGSDIDFTVADAGHLSYSDAFSVIFCNSAFQWFHEPQRALMSCYSALRTSGRMGVQAPAKKDYCPNFLAAIDAVAHDPRTAVTFSGFRPPWLFLDAADEYTALFRQAGFSVPFARIEEIGTFHTPDEVVTIFESGAAAGYLNQAYYATPIDDAYAKTFRHIVRESFHRQADQGGQVTLLFNRIYLLVVKE
jgi:trans-aconitate methyltransferase